MKEMIDNNDNEFKNFIICKIQKKKKKFFIK
jgi:hypothetical protein